MNEKRLLNIMLPATQKTYDFWIPCSMTAHDACALIAGMLERRERDRFAAGPSDMLMSRDTGELLDPGSTIRETDLVNGSRLVLV